MHKLVRRVSVVKVSGENREAKVVYEGEHEDDESKPSMESFERGLRRFLKADLIRAQETYDRHVESASSGRKGEWLFDIPSNLAHIVRAVLKEVERDTREGTKDEHEREGAKREGKKAGA